MAEESPADEGSHARARTILTVEQRVAHIVGMMERFEWERGKSAPVLAESWGLATATVEGHAAEAHRRVVADPDEVRRDITVGAKQLMKRAIATGDCQGWKAVGDLLASVSGAKAPEKRELTGKDGAPLGPVIFVPPDSEE